MILRSNQLPLSAFLTFCVYPTLVSASRPTTQFITVFPAWESRIRPILEGNCSKVYTQYLDPAETGNQATYELIDCIIKEFPEYRKAEIATAALVLGLAPFIIQQMGPRVADVGTLALRRPFLAILIGASCPIVGADMAGTFNNPAEHLSIPAMKTMRPDLSWMNLNEPRPIVVSLITAAEYLLAMATFVNLQILAWQIASWTVVVWAPHTAYHSYLWICLVLLIHMGHFWSLLLRVRVVKAAEGGDVRHDSEQGRGVGTRPVDSDRTLSIALRPLNGPSSAGQGNGHTSQSHDAQQHTDSQTSNFRKVEPLSTDTSSRSWCGTRSRPRSSRDTHRNVSRPAHRPSHLLLADSMPAWLRHELTPMAYAPRVDLEDRDHGYLYMLLGYLVSVSAAAHVLYGTLLLSSLLFISLADAVGIVWRFGANTIVCRILLGYEITAMRENVSGVMAGKKKEDCHGAGSCGCRCGSRQTPASVDS
ncbi:hypothetical protein Micbo1qcDRAFT_215502 [Microdochium bolleyi]|uniref:Uncharacterized protein n=1 Tax=Microdochium bolleyi TaxID=196109 RepID=A0A136ISA7_9PEZI|nr:hypothetical protein Micbo1qcDRAFT_215502 [Microdochium bolleyi]